jgi:RND family efflux transporter MFP subunit
MRIPDRFQSGSMLALFVALGLNGCKPAGPAANAQGSAAPVTAQTVTSSITDSSEEFIAHLESRQSVEIKPKVAGQVQRIFVRAGDAVKAGDPIIQIDAREQIAAVESRATQVDAARATAIEAKANADRAVANSSKAEAGLASAQATLENLRADRAAKVADQSFQQQQANRYRQLKADGAVSQQVVDQYVNSAANAQASLKALDARIQAQQSEIAAQRSELQAQGSALDAQDAGVSRATQQVQQAKADTLKEQANLQNYSITAPFSGTIGNVPIKEGDQVSAGTLLATVTQNDNLEVNLSVPIETVARLRVGTRVELVDQQGKTVGSSRVSFISPSASSETQSVLVKAVVENGGGPLRADQFVKARVIWQRQPALLVPKTALISLAGKNFVYVVSSENGKTLAKQKSVEVGNIQGNQQQVTQGLNPGDQVITGGIQKIRDGAPVAVGAPDAAPNGQPADKPKE